MKKPRFQAYIDGRLAYQADHIKYLKQQCDFEFEFCNAYFCEIRTGNKHYTARFYDSKWSR